MIRGPPLFTLIVPKSHQYPFCILYATLSKSTGIQLQMLHCQLNNYNAHTRTCRCICMQFEQGKLFAGEQKTEYWKLNAESWREKPAGKWQTFARRQRRHIKINETFALKQQLLLLLPLPLRCNYYCHFCCRCCCCCFSKNIFTFFPTPWKLHANYNA